MQQGLVGASECLREPGEWPKGAAAGNPSSAHEAARFIATVSLSLGALMLSLFGIIERMVTFEKLAVVDELAFEVRSVALRIS
jgi:hypothetical protein